MPNVSLLATLVGALAGFALGALWYGKLFGDAWMAELGVTRESQHRGFSPGIAYGTTFVLSLVAAYAFGVVVGPAPGLGRALALGVAVGGGFVATAIATNHLFERRGLRLTLITAGYHVVRFALIGAAFGLLG